MKMGGIQVGVDGEMGPKSGLHNISSSNLLLHEGPILLYFRCGWAGLCDLCASVASTTFPN